MSKVEDGQVIAAAVYFIEAHKKYNQERKNRGKCTSTEKEVMRLKDKFLEENPHISYVRSEKINSKTTCAHGTNGWAVFLACALSDGQLLPGHGIKLNGMFANGGENRGKDARNCNVVSTMSLASTNSKYLPLSEPMYRYAGMSSSKENYGRYNYQVLKSKITKKYKKRGKSSASRTDDIFDCNLQEVYEKLSRVPTVIIGDGICEVDRSFMPSGSAGYEAGEVLYERVNIRVIIISEKNKDFIKDLIQAINPDLAKNIAFLAFKEVKKFESNRRNSNTERGSFFADFFNSFRSEITFDKFDCSKEVYSYSLYTYKESKFGTDWHNGSRKKVKEEMIHHPVIVKYHIEDSVDDSQELKSLTKEFLSIAEGFISVRENLHSYYGVNCFYGQFVKAENRYKNALNDLEKIEDDKRSSLNYVAQSVRRLYEFVEEEIKEWLKSFDFNKHFNNIKVGCTKMEEELNGNLCDNEEGLHSINFHYKRNKRNLCHAIDLFKSEYNEIQPEGVEEACRAAEEAFESLENTMRGNLLSFGKYFSNIEKRCTEIEKNLSDDKQNLVVHKHSLDSLVENYEEDKEALFDFENLFKYEDNELQSVKEACEVVGKAYLKADQTIGNMAKEKLLNLNKSFCDMKQRCAEIEQSLNSGDGNLFDHEESLNSIGHDYEKNKKAFGDIKYLSRWYNFDTLGSVGEACEAVSESHLKVIKLIKDKEKLRSANTSTVKGSSKNRYDNTNKTSATDENKLKAPSQDPFSTVPSDTDSNHTGEIGDSQSLLANNNMKTQRAFEKGVIVGGATAVLFTAIAVALFATEVIMIELITIVVAVVAVVAVALAVGGITYGVLKPSTNMHNTNEEQVTDSTLGLV